MTSAFQERLHAGAIELNDETTERWKAAIGNYAESISQEAIADIVRTAFLRGDTSEAAVALRSACVEAGDTPELSGEAGFLTGILACEALIEVFERRGSQVFVWAGLLISAAQAKGWAPAHPDVCANADAALKRAAIQNFSPGKPPRAAGQSASTKEALDALVTADWAIYQKAIVELAGEITRLRSHSARLANYVNESQRPLLEQQELAWWVISGRSLSFDRPFDGLPPLAVPCVAALDLSRIAPRPPGPFASASFLAQALQQNAESASAETVSLASVHEQLRELKALSLFPEPRADIWDFLPILGAFHSDSSTADADNAPLQALAERTYAEILLARYDD